MTLQTDLLPAAHALRNFLREAPEIISRDDLRQHPVLAALAVLADDLAERVDHRALSEAKCRDVELAAIEPDPVKTALVTALKGWQRFAQNNHWDDVDFHDSDGTGWITATNSALKAAEGNDR